MGYVGWIGTFEGKKGTGKEKVFESEMVRELRASGAVLYCKTSVPHTLMAGETVNNIIGWTMNPKNRNLSSGGSSGGEGALIGIRGCTFPYPSPSHIPNKVQLLTSHSPSWIWYRHRWLNPHSRCLQRALRSAPFHGPPSLLGHGKQYGRPEHCAFCRRSPWYHSLIPAPRYQSSACAATMAVRPARARDPVAVR